MVNCTGYECPWFPMICLVMNIFRFCTKNNVEQNLVLSWLIIFNRNQDMMYYGPPLYHNVDAMTMVIISKLWQSMISKAMIFWTMIVQKKTAMIVMLFIPYLFKFINRGTLVTVVLFRTGYVCLLVGGLVTHKT